MTIPIQLAIQGGGAKITYLLAALESVQSLEREGVLRVTRIAGTSAGAIAGALYAAGVDMRRARDAFESDRHALLRAFPAAGVARCTWKLITRQPFWNAAPLRQWMTRLLGARETIGDLDIPLIVVASDLSNMQPCVYDAADEPLVSSIMDSAGIPFFFRTAPSPSLENYRVVVDGGICENLPAEELTNAPAFGEIVGITFGVSRPSARLTTFADFTRALLETAMNASVLRAQLELGANNFVIHTDAGSFDFRRAFDEGLGAEYRETRLLAERFFRDYADPRSPDVAAPLTPDELLLRDNIPASQPLPRELENHFSNPSLIVSAGSISADATPYITPIPGESSAYRISLPAQAIFGLPGRRAERFAAGHLSQQFAGVRYTEPFRPQWTSHIFHPKVTTAVSSPLMRSVTGRHVVPYSGVFGNDDRITLYPGGYPFNCVGKLFTYGDDRPIGKGTGVLIGPRHVLTAGHMVSWSQARWGMQFVPGYYNGKSVDGPGVNSWVSDAQGWNTGNTVAAHDMAVLRLYEPLGDWLGWFGATVYSDAWQGVPRWQLIGYPGAVAGGEKPSWEIFIAVLDDDSDGDALELEHQGDSGPGDSGGPFFSIWPDSFPYVVGTLSGGETITGGLFGIGNEDNNIAAGGKAMVDLIIWARNNWV